MAVLADYAERARPTASSTRGSQSLQAPGQRSAAANPWPSIRASSSEFVTPQPAPRPAAEGEHGRRGRSRDPRGAGVSGFFRAAPRGVSGRARGAPPPPAEADVKPQRFLPSSRSVAFRRGAWAAAGGYPEWLDYCEDL